MYFKKAYPGMKPSTNPVDLPQISLVPGSQNHSGLCVFSVTPAGGAVGAGESQDLMVRFKPDHPSVRYADRLKVELMDKVSGPAVFTTEPDSHVADTVI